MWVGILTKIKLIFLASSIMNKRTSVVKLHHKPTPRLFPAKTTHVCFCGFFLLRLLLVQGNA